MKCLVRIGKMVFPIRYEQQVSTSPPAVFLLHLSLSYATLSTYESIKFFAFLEQQALMTEIMKKSFDRPLRRVHFFTVCCLDTHWSFINYSWTRIAISWIFLKFTDPKARMRWHWERWRYLLHFQLSFQEYRKKCGSIWCNTLIWQSDYFEPGISGRIFCLFRIACIISFLWVSIS